MSRATVGVFMEVTGALFVAHDKMAEEDAKQD